MATLSDFSRPAASGSRLEVRAWLRTVGRAGPERWVWTVAMAGWALLVWAATGWYPLGQIAMAGHHHAGMTHPAPAADPGGAAAFGVHLLLWTAMVAATMLPLIARNLRLVGMRSPRSRRTRATLDVAAGWAVVWLASGVMVSLGLVATSAVSRVALVGAVCVLAIGWQFTRSRRLALARCHRTFAPPLGRTATRACVRFGTSLGRDCLLTCWPAMALMAVAGHQLIVVVALGWLSWQDIRRAHDSPGTALSVTVLAVVGVFAALVQG